MGHEELENLVREYKSGYRNQLLSHLDFYKSLESLDEVLESAPAGRDLNNDKHKHQWRITDSALESTRGHLLRHKTQFLNCTNFEDVRRQVGQCKVAGFGKLAVYDTALRISAYLNNFMPEYIYLHCGTKEGARNLGVGYNREYITRDELPESLRELEPYDIEAFLCVSRNRLRVYENN